MLPILWQSSSRYLPFGGMNMIFMGDFAHLLPAIGGKNASLYGASNGLEIWHQVITVVMLRQNMRQQTQSKDDQCLRTALANMQYKACTQQDIVFLQSKVSCGCTASWILEPEFHNVSIITVETLQELTNFYCDDKLSTSESANCPSPGYCIRAGITSISAELCRILWGAPPCSNDKHIPPVLSICKGMPVMIRHDSATELCMTKGQEGTVYTWKESDSPNSQKMLDVLFVALSDPPTEVHIPGLPLNVAPIMHTSTTIMCSLPDDTVIQVTQSQVEVLPNFAMTDFSSQGKTRPYNMVDLNNCCMHQSYYTTLSRTATAAGTLILPAIKDSTKIQGNCSGRL
ncbi:hypothetical protein IW262DRAFT_1450838 [Armillaria fumosa]|nr:hypothetical protein IW262DRAFT_1450838 [Armillaria fumosa]